ncbi:MAG: hypothetical protein CBB97_13660, partial [Candidatus Endolissoclinum sp. TMED37]
KVIAAGRRFGKEMTLDTPILTTEGWKTMGTIKEGDYAFGLDGNPTRVQGISDIHYNNRVYKLTFSDGSVLKANPEHEWYVESQRYRKQKGRGAKYDHIKTIYTTQEMVDEGVRKKRTDSRVENNFAIPVAAPLNLPIAQLPFEPYSLGVWLGDGMSDYPEFCCDEKDYEIVENFGYETKEKKTALHKVNEYSFCGEYRGQMKGILKDIGVLKNKHIPEQYLMASEVQRLFLLQGLMDTDGTVSKSGHCEYCGVNERLVRDVWRLVISLGIKATVIEGDAKLNGEVVGRKYRVCFTTDKPVFKLKRKLDRLYGQKKKDINRRFIVSIEEIESEPMRCIAVDSPDHLYLAGESLIATHNTLFSIYSMIEKATMPDSRVWYVTSSYRAAKQICWDQLKAILYPTGFIDKINEADLSIRLINGSQIVLRGSDQPDSLRGVSLDFVCIDEAAYCDPRVWTEVLRPTLSDRGGSATFISSPQGRDWFYDLYMRGQNPEEPQWQSWQFTTLQGGNVPKEEIEAARRDLDDKTFRQEYEASFVQYSGIVYYNFHPEDSIRNWEYQKGKQVLIGLDFNINPMSAIVCQKKDDQLFVFDEIVIWSSNTDEMADEIRSRYKVEDCIIYPDPASQQRKTSAGGKTDLSILQNYGFRVRVKSSHDYIRDRNNAVNSRLLSSDGERHLFFTPHVKRTIESIGKLTYKEGTSVVDKSKGLDHLCLTGGTLVETERGLQKLSAIDPEGLIKTYNDKWTEYIYKRQTGISEDVLSIDLESGGTIECTGDHPILTIHGFVEAKELRIGEMLIKPNKDYKPPKPSERSVGEDLNDFIDSLPVFVKNKLCEDRVIRVRKILEPQPVYNLFVPRWHCFQIVTEPVEKRIAIVHNCDALAYCVSYLHPIRRGGKGVSSMTLSGL